MSSHCREPRLKDMLADSIVKAMMEADGVDQRELEAELRQTATLLRATQHTLRSRDLWDSAADTAKSTRTTRSGQPWPEERIFANAAFEIALIWPSPVRRHSEVLRPPTVALAPR
jgi:hypothetical protein